MRRVSILLLLPLLLGTAARSFADGTADPATSLAPLAASEWTRGAAAHLLRRAGFGGTPEAVEALHALGLKGAVEHLLEFEGRPDPDVPDAPISLTRRPDRRQMRQAKDSEARLAIRQAYRRADRRQLSAIREWWAQRMARTAWPLRERMVLFWHGHFTSSYRDVRNSYHLYVQNELFRRRAAGSFAGLLHAVSKDPAMLEYLDNNRNRKAHPNENYAREVMELFTLGLGNYTEDDIREGARALTGWTFRNNDFVFARRQHDGGRKTILGQTGNFNGDDFLDILLEQPACARFLVTKLFRYFAHDDPDEAVVAGLAKTLRRGAWQVRPVLRQLFTSRAFYAEPARGSKIKSPLELLVGLYKSLDIDARLVPGTSLMAQSLGQSLIDPPNVKGWPGGRDWVTTSTLLARYNLAGAVVGLPQDRARAMRTVMGGRGRRMMAQLQRTRRQQGARDGMGAMEEDEGDEGNGDDPDRRRRRRRRNRGPVAPLYDVLGAVRSHGLVSAPEIVAFYTGALLANPVSDDMRRSLLAYLDPEGEGDGDGDGSFDPEAPGARQRLHGLLRLIVSSPEFQLL